MASIYRLSYLAPDRATGRRVRRKSRIWYVGYTDAQGVRQRVPGYTDREATKALAAELERKVARGEVGILDPFEAQRKRLLADHLDDYRRHLASKGNTGKHVALVCARVKAVLDGCRFLKISDLSAGRVGAWLAARRAPKPPATATSSDPPAEERRPGSGISAQTSNFYLAAVKSFSRWLVRDRRIGEDPFAHISGLNVRTDRRHDRRGLAPGEFEALLEAARTGETSEGLSGSDRAMLYLTAGLTGLRAAELASLTAASFDLAADPATVALEAAYSKHRRRDVLPVHPALVQALRPWLTARMPSARLWPGKWFAHAARMIRADLKKAGIAYRDSTGRVFDFHALRHHFVSALARSGVHPKEAQALARHSTIALTMDRYTHLGVMDAAAALGRLPAPGLPLEAASATGTFGASRVIPLDHLLDHGTGNSMQSGGTRSNGREAKEAKQWTAAKSHNSLTGAAIGNEGQREAAPGKEKKMEAAPGFEPGNNGFANRRPETATAYTNKELRNQETAIGPRIGPRNPEVSPPPAPSSELARVIAAWPNLPTHGKATILGLLALAEPIARGSPA